MPSALRLFILGALACVLGASAISCTDNDGGKRSENHLNFGCYNYSNSLDPATNVNSSWCGVRYGITECLFRFSDKVVPENNLCDGYAVSDDFTTWTLHIRDNVFFSNGKPLTASAVKASLERLYAETDAARGGKGNSNPEGYLIYESLTADDQAGTVTIVCKAPTANLPGILAYPYFAVIDASVADKEIVGTGPYCVERIKTGINIDMKRNPHYWNGPVPYDTVSVIFIDDSSTKAMALQRGDIDVVENITTASDVKSLSGDPAYDVSTAASVRTGNSYFNFKGILGNAALRQAIIMALDSETMCRTTVAEMYTAGISVLPSSLAYNYDRLVNPYPYNVEKARETLDKAGIIDTDGDGLREMDGTNIRLDYVVFTSRNLNDFAEAIALQLKDVGIDVNVRLCDYDTALGLQNAGEFDIITSNSITVGVGDPQDFLGNWYSKNSVNYGYYKSHAYDRCYEELMTATDKNKRVELVTQLQQILIDDAAAIVHGYYNSRMFSRASLVTGAEIATIDYYWLTTRIAPKP